MPVLFGVFAFQVHRQPHSVLAKLHDLAQSVANLPDKVRHKQEERGL